MRRYLLLILLPLFFLLFSACIGIDLKLNPPLEKHLLFKKGHWVSDSIVIVDISGEIGDEGSLITLEKTTPRTLMEILAAIEKDKQVKAIVLRINSPGGEVMATDTMLHELLHYKKRSRIPIYASIVGLGCSGSYYLALAADKIYAQPSSIIGSIGVIARIPQLTKLADKIGYSEEIIKSGLHKDMGHPLKIMPKSDREIIQKLIDNYYEQFLTAILHHRSKLFPKKEALKKIADGRVYTANEALENGLIDQIGYLREVLSDVATKAHLTKYNVITYRYGRNPDASFYSKKGAPEINLINLKSLGIQNKTGFFYLWELRP